jgi:hypothetical protein
MTDTPTPAKGIKDILDNAGVDTTGWALTVGRLLDKDRQIAVLDSGGLNPEVKMSIDYPSIQINVLGSKGPDGYPEAYAKAKAIRDAIQAIPSAPAQFPELTSCVQRGGINFLGYNENDRPRFTTNFQLITEPAPAGYREAL